MIGSLQDRAIVYKRDNDGNFTVVDRVNLHGRVIAPQIRPADVGRERNELTDTRYFTWQPDYLFPDEWCQVVVDGTTYNTIAGTFKIIRDPWGKVVLRRCDVQRASE